MNEPNLSPLHEILARLHSSGEPLVAGKTISMETLLEMVLAVYHKTRKDAAVFVLTESEKKAKSENVDETPGSQ